MDQRFANSFRCRLHYPIVMYSRSPEIYSGLYITTLFYQEFQVPKMEVLTYVSCMLRLM